ADFSPVNFLEVGLPTKSAEMLSLHEAGIYGVDLTEIDLTGADLTRANLERSNLDRTNFNRAKLLGTNFRGSTIRHTVFADVDLSQVKGFEKVTHIGPSTIGIDTLYNSQGKIPEAFLRGCGLPEEFIIYSRSLVGKAIEYYSCFISYS